MTTGHFFTSCGVTGRAGPTIAQMRAAYGTSWDEDFLKEGRFQGYQDWTIPVSGVYELDVCGASGYMGTGSGDVGRGARIKCRLELTKNETITIVVGQMGEAPSVGTVYGGSGGGTFVIRKSGDVPLVVAGGGSATVNASGQYREGGDGQLTFRGGTGFDGLSGGENGFGGPALGGYSGGGGGFFGPGKNGTRESGGANFFSGLAISSTSVSGSGAGGFGGAGNSDGISGQSGGAGGYSGGAGARTFNANYVGGGGGSFINSSAENVGTSNGTFEETSLFNGENIEDLQSYNYGDGFVKVELIEAFATGNTIHPTAVDAEAGTNAIEIEPNGSSYHSLVPINYDIENDLIYSTSPHGFVNGQAISFDFEDPTPDISESAVYYVNKIDDYSFGLVYSPAVNFTTPSGKSDSDVIRTIVVNLDLDSLNIPNHGFSVDQPIQYNSGDGDPIQISDGTLTDGETYYVSEVVDADNIKLKNAIDSPSNLDFVGAGTGTSHSFVFLTVNLNQNTLYIPNHGLVSGQTIQYNNNGGNSVGGLTDGSVYFVKRIDDSTIELYDDSNVSDVANRVDLSSTGTGTHSLSIRSINFATDTIIIPQHGFLGGEIVEYDSRGQTEIAGLTTNDTYYVIFVDGDNIKLADSAENAQDNVAVNLQESPSGVGTHTLTNLNETPDGIYTINNIPTEDTFEVQARGQVSKIEKFFNPRSSVLIELNQLFIPSHGFLTGTKVTYSNGDAGTDIGGLTDATDYYVVTVNQDYFKLSASLNDALAGETVEITNFGSGVAHTLETNQLNGSIVGSGNVSVNAGSVLVNGQGTSFSKILKVGDSFTLYPKNTEEALFFEDTNVNTQNDRIEISHNFNTGDYVKFNAGDGVAPTPLIDGYYYYIGVVDSNAVKLYTSLAAAQAAGSSIEFSTSGTGDNFSLTQTIPVGPIVRRITAVGSDLQITVDRPYSSEYNQVDYAYPTFAYVRPSGYSLHRPFDGGVEMSTGSENSFAQMIRQTRKYFRYQSGKGIQTSFAINFKPSIDIESMERFSSTRIEVKTRREHNLVSGLSIEIAEAQDSSGEESNIYNGIFQVSIIDATTFRVVSNQAVPEGTESRAYGFPQFHVRSWTNGAIRSGMFDFQNGMFFEFDGQEIYCVRRSSTQQVAGTVSALRGSELIFGDKTSFAAQLAEGDSIVLRGQTYRVIDVQDDTTLSVRPEYRGSTGLEISFDPATQVNTTTNTFFITRHGLSQNIPVIYNSIDGESIGGLINGRTYYADVVDANSFKLLPNLNASSAVNLSSAGTTNLHSFVPAKSGIIVTKTVDTKIPQSEWSVDVCDGSGPSGYDLDLSRIQMCYMDYSWYGAGKIRFGFKTNDGLVRYVHEFKHNNILYESYFRSGNLPARYEVSTGLNPTYIPSLFHWGTSVIMDGTFDDDRGYLFTEGSQNLNVEGTTTKSFASSGIDTATDLVTSLTHGFQTGDTVDFQSIASDGVVGSDSENPKVQVVGSNTFENLKSNESYKILVNSPDRIHLVPKDAPIRTFNDFEGGVRTQQDGDLVTVYAQDHGYSTGDYVGVYGSTRVSNGSYPINVIDQDTFTYKIFQTEEFTTPGSFSWTAPEEVTEVSVVAIGGGGGGNEGTSNNSGAGGGGGLGWRYRVSVTPGESYPVIVGAGGFRDTDNGGGFNSDDGEDSYFINLSTVAGLGGQRGQEGTGGNGGGYIGDGGGNGGRGGNGDGDDSGGGGGAGGYFGDGGLGGDPDQNGQDGQGGGGGGAGSSGSGDSSGGGGGVGFSGLGESGAGSSSSNGNSAGGSGGSGGQKGTNGDAPRGDGGIYGGGGGGADNDSNENGSGADGAVKLIWNSTGKLTNTYPEPGSQFVPEGADIAVVFSEVINFIDQGNTQYTYFVFPSGSLNNTTGPNYQPLISLRLSPSADSGLTGKLGDRDIINRMQLRMQEIGVSTNELVEVKLILNGRLNNLGFTPVAPPSLTEIVEHTPQDTISGGIQVYNFQASGGETTSVGIDSLFELSNSILGGDNIFPDGPDILTVCVSRLTGNATRTSANLTWTEAQA